MDRVLITGATSYLGQVLARQHLARGDDVYVLVRPSTDRAKLTPGLAPDNVLVDHGDQKHLTDIMALCQPMLLHHLAGLYVREPVPEQVPALMETNLTFGTRLLEALRKAGQSPRFVNATSQTIFYDSVSPRPLNLYAATKLAFEAILNYYADGEGLIYCSLVLYDTYGPNDPRVKLMTAIRDAQAQGKVLPLTDDDIVLDLVHIEDVAQAFIAADALLKTDERAKGKRFAVSQGERIQTSALVALFEKLGNKPIDKQWGAFPLPDRKILTPWSGAGLPNWTPQISIREGVKEMIQSVKPE